MSAVIQKVDVLGALAHRVAVLESDGFVDTADTWRAVRRSVEEIIIEAQYVIENPSARNLADLRAALARLA